MTIQEKINQINKKLQSCGKEAVQEIKMIDKSGKTIGKIRYGYKPQYVFDAVNEFIGADNWRYKVLSSEIFEKQTVVQVGIYFRSDDGKWLSKGQQFGQMNVIRGNAGDAYKGAVTDALQKALSLMSIGSDAYKGLLKQFYNGARTNTTKINNPKKSNDKKPVAKGQSVSNKDLPELDGVNYKREAGKVIAIGNTYNYKGILKAAGFSWDAGKQVWLKAA